MDVHLFLLVVAIVLVWHAFLLPPDAFLYNINGNSVPFGIVHRTQNGAPYVTCSTLRRW